MSTTTVADMIAQFPELSRGRKVSGADLELLHARAGTNKVQAPYTLTIKPGITPDYPLGSDRRLFLGGDERGKADAAHAAAEMGQLASTYNGAAEAREIAAARDVDFRFKMRNAAPATFSQRGRIHWELFAEGLTERFDPFLQEEVDSVFAALGRRNDGPCEEVGDEAVFVVSYKHYLDGCNKMSPEAWKDIVNILRNLLGKGLKVRLWIDSKAPKVALANDAVGWVAKGIYPYTVLPVITPANHYGRYSSRLWIDAEQQLALHGEGLYTLVGGETVYRINITGRGDYGTRELACRILNGEFGRREGQSEIDDKLLCVFAMHELRTAANLSGKIRYHLAEAARSVPDWDVVDAAECVFNEWRCRRGGNDVKLGESTPCWDVVARTFPGVFQAWKGAGFEVAGERSSTQWLCADENAHCVVLNPRCVALAGRRVSVMYVNLTPGSSPVQGHVLESVLTIVPTEKAKQMTLQAPERKCKWAAR